MCLGRRVGEDQRGVHVEGRILNYVDVGGEGRQY